MQCTRGLWVQGCACRLSGCKDPSLWQLRSGQSNPAGYDSCMLLLCHLIIYLGTTDALRTTSSKFV